MGEFLRATTEEQKELRRRQIKAVAREQFLQRPLSQISLSTIASDMSLTRAGVYRYYSNVSEILVDIWSDLYSELCLEFNDRLRKIADCRPEDYAELQFQIYFNRNEFLRYATMMPVLARDPECKKYLAKIRPTYRRYILEHLDLLVEKFGLTRDKAEAIHSEGFYEALGVSNAETMEAEVVPAISDRYQEYMHRKYVTHMTVYIILAIQHSKNPELDPANSMDLSYINDYRNIFRENVKKMKFE